jgi:hypothetical protein
MLCRDVLVLIAKSLVGMFIVSNDLVDLSRMSVSSSDLVACRKSIHGFFIMVPKEQQNGAQTLFK